MYLLIINIIASLVCAGINSIFDHATNMFGFDFLLFFFLFSVLDTIIDLIRSRKNP